MQKERTFCAIKFTKISPGVPAISSLKIDHNLKLYKPCFAKGKMSQENI